MQADTPTVEAYLASLPDDRREALTAIRDVIRERLPDGIEEACKHGMIVYVVPLATQPDTYNGQPLLYAGLASQKRHMSLYLTGIYVDPAKRAAFETAWAAAGHKLNAGKSCVRFTKLEKVPLDVVGDAIAAFDLEGFVAAMQAATRK